MPEPALETDEPERIGSCDGCEPDGWDAARETLVGILVGDVEARDVLCWTHNREVKRLTQLYTLHRHGIDLPDDHPWREASRNDRGAQVCRDCDVAIPFTANDIQAGIRLHCPDCLGEMEWVV